MALHYLNKYHSNVKLVLDGAGPREWLQRFSERLGVQDKVIFSHAKCDEELAEVYSACDAFVFPPQITWGLAVVEAMASSKPVIVAKGCGAAEIIQDNVNGMLVDYAKPKTIAEKVENLMSDQSLREKLGRNAFNYVKDNLSWKKFAVQMEEIFKKITQNQ